MKIDPASDLAAQADAILRNRIETLIAYNRALIAVAGLLILMFVAGWQTQGENIRDLNRFKADQQDTNRNQAEWNQHILRVLWMLHNDPKGKTL